MAGEVPNGLIGIRKLIGQKTAAIVFGKDACISPALAGKRAGVLLRDGPHVKNVHHQQITRFGAFDAEGAGQGVHCQQGRLKNVLGGVVILDGPIEPLTAIDPKNVAGFDGGNGWDLRVPPIVAEGFLIPEFLVRIEAEDHFWHDATPLTTFYLWGLGAFFRQELRAGKLLVQRIPGVAGGLLRRAGSARDKLRFMGAALGGIDQLVLRAVSDRQARGTHLAARRLPALRAGSQVRHFCHGEGCLKMGAFGALKIIKWHCFSYHAAIGRGPRFLLDKANEPPIARVVNTACKVVSTAVLTYFSVGNVNAGMVAVKKATKMVNPKR